MKIDSHPNAKAALLWLKSPVLVVFLGSLLALAATGCSADSKKASLLERANGFFDAGEYDEARIEYMNVLRQDPQNPTAIQQLGIIWFEGGAPLKAGPFLHKAAELAPDNLSVRTKLARALLELGQREEARKEAVAIIDRAPSTDEAVVLLGATAISKEEIDDTEKRLQQMTNPDRAAVHVALADLAIHKGGADAAVTAEKEIQRALQLDAKSIFAQMAMANLSLANRDLSRAGEALKTAVDLAPVRSPARIKLAELKAASGDVQEARALLQEMTKETPDYLPAWQLQAQLTLGEKKYDDALALLKNIMTRDPSNLAARLLEAEAWTLKGDIKKSISLLEDLRSIFPKAPIVLYRLGRAYMQDANLAQARAVLNQAVAAAPNFTDAVLVLARLELTSGNAMSVVPSMQGLLKHQPGLIQANLLLAEAYQKLGRLDDAAAVFREQIKTTPQSSVSHFMLGMALRQKGDLVGAHAAFAKAQELAPDDLLPTYQLIELDILNKDFNSAHQMAREQIRKKPDSAGAQFLEGKTFAAQGDWDQAEKALTRALELDPNSTSAYETLIGTYIGGGKLPQALAQLEARLVKVPDDMRALMTLALIYEKLNEFPKARDKYEKILSRSPEFVPALNNLAYLYVDRMDQLGRAYELAQKARTLSPADPSVADTLGWVLYKQGNYQAALGLLTDSAGKQADNPEFQYHLGMAAYMMGQSDVARKALKTAAEAQSEFRGKTEIQGRLAVLGDGTRPATQLNVADLEAALQKQPNDPMLQVRLAEAHEQQGSIEKAEDAYEKAFKLNPMLASTAVKLAQLHAGSLKNPDKAMEYARKARELAPNDSRAAAILGTLTYREGGYAQAYALLGEGARGLPDDAGVLHDFAWAAYSLGKVDEARKSMQRLLDATSASTWRDDATSFLAMTDLDPGAGDLTAAASKIDELLQKTPEYMPALMARAALLVKRGEASSAADLYSRVLNKFPDFAPAQKWLATLYAADSANHQKGYDLAVKARKTLPEDPDLARTLAELAFHQNEFAYAATLFQESARKRPLNAKGLYCLGRSLLATKQTSEGKAALEQALAAGLQEPFVSEARHALNGLDTK